MEGNVIQTLNFELLSVTAFSYFECVNHLNSFSSKDYFLCLYLLEISLFSLSFKKYHPKTIAGSVAFFVNKLRKKHCCWTGDLAQAFQMTEQELKPCARDICVLWQRI